MYLTMCIESVNVLFLLLSDDGSLIVFHLKEQPSFCPLAVCSAKGSQLIASFPYPK